MTAATFSFVGVTTGQSSMVGIFPRWMARLGHPEIVLEGIDLSLHAPPAAYRAVVERIRSNPASIGGLVTTHKIDLLEACRDLFDRLDSFALELGEVSAIAKGPAGLTGYATDPLAAGSSLDALLGDSHFGETGGEVLLLGAGGAAAAIVLHLIRHRAADPPSRVTVVNRSQPRLDRLRAIVERQATDLVFDFRCTEDPRANDLLLERLPPGTLVVNATGMGKDRPGSPLTDAARFPVEAVAWELNYRGELAFLRQARSQPPDRGVRVEDGWGYFVRGWSEVVARVLDVDITPDVLDDLATLAGDRGAIRPALDGTRESRHP
ncbi:MAG TPA: shikimate dehydrogenase [Clostridia bacterium]|nr:shikimate dehydrogenase [Clostridia bacterium]